MNSSILGKLALVSSALSAFAGSALASSLPQCYVTQIGRTNYAVKITSSNSYYAGSQVSWLEMTTTERGRVYSNVAMADGDAIRELKRYGVVDFSGEDNGGYLTVTATSRNSIVLTGRVGSSFELYDSDPYSDSFDPYVSRWSTPTSSITLYKSTCVKYARYYKRTTWNTYRNYGQHGPRHHHGPYGNPGHHVPQYPTQPTYPTYPNYPGQHGNPGNHNPGHHNPGHQPPVQYPTYPTYPSNPGQHGNPGHMAPGPHNGPSPQPSYPSNPGQHGNNNNHGGQNGPRGHGGGRR